MMMNLRRIASVGAVASVALLASLWGSVAMAGQFVVLDETWVHGPNMPDSHYRVGPSAETPADWVSPIDYTQGKAYLYLEVHSKPTAQETKFQVCFEANPTYACTAQSPTYTTTGVIEWDSDFAGFWSPPGEKVDWTQGVNKIAVILKDTMNGKPSADNVGPETAALYMPTEVRMVVTIVEPGSVYVPPTPTGEGSSSGGEDTDASGDTGSSGEPGTTDGSDTAPATSTTAEPATDTGTVVTTDASTGEITGGEVVTEGQEPQTTGVDATTSGTGGAATDTTGPTQEPADQGCACTTTSPGRAPPTALALAGVLLALGSRRRAAKRR